MVDMSEQLFIEHNICNGRAPLVFPNPASSMGRVFATFTQSTDWKLVNAMGQTLDQGCALAGTRVAWQSLSPGMYVVQTNSGATPLVVAH